MNHRSLLFAAMSVGLLGACNAIIGNDRVTLLEGEGGSDASVDGSDAELDVKSRPDGAAKDTGAGESGSEASMEASTTEDVAPGSDASDGGNKSDASDAAGDAGHPVSCSTTTIGDFADAGELLFGFDGVTGGAPAGWITSTSDEGTDAGSLFTLGSSSTVGDTCPGSLELTARFMAYGESVEVEYNYAPATDWTGRTMLHASVMITASETDFAALIGTNSFVQSNNYADFTAQFTVAATFSDENWHEISLALQTGSSYDPTAVNQFAIQLLTSSEKPDGGPAAPGSVVMYVDDIWIE
jgi:hypothetical protein